MEDNTIVRPVKRYVSTLSCAAFAMFAVLVSVVSFSLALDALARLQNVGEWVPLAVAPVAATLVGTFLLVAYKKSKKGAHKC